MYPHHAERLTDALDRSGLEAIVATSPANIRYLTGFSSVSRAAYPDVDVHAIATRHRTALVIPTIDAATVAVDGAAADVIAPYGRFFVETTTTGDPRGKRLGDWIERPADTPGDAVLAALRSLGVETGRIGLDDRALTARGWRELTERLSGFTIVDAADALQTARAIKGPYEIECLERATRITEEAVNAVIQWLRPRVTEREAVTLYEAEVVKRGAVPHCSLITVGERAALPAAHPSDRMVRKGDLVRFDLGAVVNGYHADVARTAVLGEPTTRQTEVHAAVLAGVEAALATVRPGMLGRETFALVIDAVRKAGLLEYRRHHVGHGVGLEPREPPLLAADSDVVLEAGMVLRVEAPYYELGWGGASVKEMLLVMLSGARSLNRSQRGLIVLD